MDIAIVGAGCRLPGSINGPTDLWRRLRAGDDLVTEIPADRWNTDLYKHPRPGEPGRSYTFRAAVIEDPAAFDPAFFGISPREAEQMDPQQRLLMETAFEAVEAAGWTQEGLSRANCAVYVGISGTEYANLRLGDPSGGDAHFMTGNTLSIAANRLSYVFDLSGPSMAVDTACSSAVAALYEACCGLVEGRFDQAIVGAVNLLLSPYPFLGFSRASMLSDYGQSRAFAEGASGYVRGEGAGVLTLKPLANALADGDPVRAVIRAVDINQDGRTNGIALPSVGAQQALLERIYPAAGVDPADVDYFEAHGTGTAVGDPTEAGAIGRALGQGRSSDDPLLIGSIKTNIGHLEPAAGMAGVMKAMLSLENGEIPPSLHAEHLNPIIPFEELNLEVARKLTPLRRRAGAGLVGVNSFGFGGLNGHVIVEGPPRRSARRRSLAPANDGEPEPSPWPIALSARGAEALPRRASDLADALEHDPALTLRDVAFTLWRRRSHMERRLVVRAQNRTELVDRLRKFAEGDTASGISGGALGPEVRTAFAFSGNGAQWAGMGQRLAGEDAAFAAGARRASEAIAALANWSTLDLLAGPADAISLERTEIAQPLLFTVQVGLIEAMAARGIYPDATVGHSVGEIAAAYAAGALDLEQAARVIVRRSEAQAMTQGQGRMAAVAMDAAQISARLQRSSGRVELAAINSPNAVTLAGPADALSSLVEALSADDIDARMLDLDYAFHSRAMEPARAPLAASLTGLAPRPSKLPFFSCVHGAQTEGEDLDADYWWQNVRAPVRFNQAIAALIDSAPGSAWTILEIGPHPILQSYIRQTARSGSAQVRPLGVMAKQAHGADRLETVADEAFCLGAKRDPEAVGPERGDVVDLPAYPWQHDRYWYKRTDEAEGLVMAPREGALLGFRTRQDAWTWDSQIDTETYPYLADHKVGDAVVFPAAGYIATLLEAAAAMAGAEADGPVALEEFEIRRPLVLDDDRSTMVRVVVSESGRADFLARPRLSEGPWSLHARARIVRGATPPAAQPLNLDASAELEPEALYAFAKDIGLDYGPAFRPIEALSVGEDAALAALAPPAAPPRGGRRVAAPEQVDAAMQTLIALLMRHGLAADGAAMLPVAVNRIVARPDIIAAAASARLTRASERIAVADLALIDENGAPALIAEGARFQRIALKDARDLADQTYVWRSTPQTDARDMGEACAAPLAKLAAAARAAAAATPPAAKELRRLDQIAKLRTTASQAARWRAFWSEAPEWSAEAALLGARIAGEAPDDARIEQLVASSPSFAAMREALDASLKTAIAVAPASRRLRVLELGGPGGPLAERYAAEIAADTLDWTLVDTASDRRARAAAAGAAAMETLDEAETGYDVLLAPMALSPDAAAAATKALAPGGRLLAAAPKPRPWLDDIWRAALDASAAAASDWRESLGACAETFRMIDCGAGAVWLATTGAARAEIAPSPATGEPLGGDWLIAGHAGGEMAAKALSRRLNRMGVSAEVLSPTAKPELLDRRLASVDTLAIVLGGDDAAPGDAITAAAQPALAAARASNAALRLVLLNTADTPVAAGVAGLVGVLANETPDLKPITATLPIKGMREARWAELAAQAMPGLIEARDSQGEDVFTLDRAGQIASPRLVKLETPPATNGGLGFKPGALDTISWRAPRAAAALADNAIEIDVKAAGVNFRDIMFGLGALPEEAVEAGFAGATVGMEAAGVVRRVGKAVTRFAPGDRVVCVASGCFADRVTTLESAAAAIPEDQDFGAAATLPIVALTAYYSLASLADLGPEDTILIHGAAGGVGLAAIQYAQHVGARVIATAGTPEKRALLRLLGVEHITDSRSLAFVDDVKRWTDGAGVDVALNSLAGEAMSATLALMRPFGRFIELGKRDFFENTEVGLKRLRENVSYFAVDADQLLAARPELAARLFREVETLIRDRVFQPLPFRAFPAAALPDALRWMQRGRHVGKVVVTAPPEPASVANGLEVRRDATYLVVGGLEGFGLETARWLAKRGAGRLILAGRRGPETPGADAAVADLKALGAQARAVRLDVTNPKAVLRTLRRIDAKNRPLKGVVHAAARYADGLAAEMTPESVRAAVSVKADGAAALDAASRILAAEGRALDFFVLYSSATTVLGNPGQANYVAGNAAAEAIARDRRRDGFPAMAVGWGPIRDTGALQRQASVAAHLERQLGRPAMAPQAALDLLDPLWASGEAAPAVLDVDWRALGPRMRSAARFERVAPKDSDEDSADFIRLISGMDEADARDVVAELIAEKVAEVLGMTPDQVDVARPVADLGLDSLMGMELKLGLEERLGVDLPAMLLAEGASVARIAEKVTLQLRSGAGVRDDRTHDEVDRTLQQHAESLDPEAVEEAITTFRQDSERRRLLS